MYPETLGLLSGLLLRSRNRDGENPKLVRARRVGGVFLSGGDEFRHRGSLCQRLVREAAGPHLASVHVFR
jgi:hypothetical protein